MQEQYEVVVGLEIHVELQTESKIFCGCSTAFGKEPNSNCCPVCLGLPGSLPVMNEKALEYAIRAGLALDCAIHDSSAFDRKNYFYPDLPKAYQVSQYYKPLCLSGHFSFPTEEGEKTCRIQRVHLEEEAGKSVHSGESILGSLYSDLDYNRAGIPLIEIVTEPDLRSPKEARIFLEELKLLLQYLSVSDCKMEEGSLRCDANVSLRLKHATTFGTRVEIKNLNSFKAVEYALSYEVKRQEELYRKGDAIQAETRTYDERKNRTFSMRGKEESQDYRYFPEPDLPPLVVCRERIRAIKDDLPELPRAKRQRMVTEYGISPTEASVLCQDAALALFFEEVVSEGASPNDAANWILGDMLRLLRLHNQVPKKASVRPKALASLIWHIREGRIHGKQAKMLLEELFTSCFTVEELIQEKGLTQITDRDILGALIDKLLAQNADSVRSYRQGKSNLLGFFVGQVMKETKSKANPLVVNSLLKEKLEASSVAERESKD